METKVNLRGSYNELLSALSNLTSNAVRYTPEHGKIDIYWQMRGEEAVFTVQDTGIGIEAQHLPRLTERFYRVDSGRSRDTGGTGLGLSIVKHILHHHQASLQVESEPGQGSRFQIVFPAQRVLPA
jgi:two-component system phosphate regulon sensor histidine kinase PhoR